MTSRPRPGLGDCAGCQERVLFALAAGGELVALSNGSDGPLVVRWDVTNTPRCRRAIDDRPLADGEHRFRPHLWSCPALARVRPLAAAPAVPAGRRRRPAPERSRASA